MQPKPIPTFHSDMEAMDAGIAEANRRERGDFDGLLGGFDELSSGLLRDILTRLRGYLLDRYTDKEASDLLDAFEPPIVKGGASSGVVHWHTPVVDTDIELAVDLMNMIRSAARCEGERFANLILGPAGVSGVKWQAGAHKPKRPQINDWIGKQLDRNPVAKCPALWHAAPEWITDDIGIDAFRKRITAVRKLRRK